MANVPDEPDDRSRKLDHVLEQVGLELELGRSIVVQDWIRKHPDLNPELAERLTKLIGGEETVAAAGMTLRVEDETVELESMAARPSSPDAGETAAFSSGEQPTEIARNTLDWTSASSPTGTIASDSHIDASGETAFHASAANPVARHDSETKKDQPLSAGSRIRYIGDYELIGVLGQGGMGVVYKAKQISLNRNVALKMIRNAEFAGEDQLRRFQNEAEAVALLDHPGIVPIYEVSNYEDQRYFSMKLIEGDALDKRLKEFSKNPAAAAELIAKVADAVHHAHQRGLLHRDLKPANILVDGRGDPHVTDFGLAKRIEGESGLTVSGAIMGTPAYMAPEQALGRNSQVTTASDVYGLGAILYAVLAGQAPFGGDSVLETLEKVRQNAPEAPSRFNAKLPVDLEVICLKCLEKDQKRRYSSAMELADDLRRWLNFEPIQARPVSTAVRAWMWCKRKPALAGLSAALTVALIAGVIGITWQWREAVFQKNSAVVARDAALFQEANARKAEDEAKTARDAAQAARVLAEQNAVLAARQATLALETIQEFINRVQTGLNGPGLYDVKTAILNTALTRIDQVASVYDKSTSKEATVLSVYMLLAGIYRELGQSEKAGDLLTRSLDIARERVKIKAYSDPSRQNLANVYKEFAILSEEVRRDMKAALKYNQESLKIWEDVDKNPKIDGFEVKKFVVHYFLAEAYTRVAASHYRLGDVAAAREDFRKAYNLRTELVREMKDDPARKQELSFSTMALAETSYRTGNKAQADQYYRQVLDQRAAMYELKPKDARITAELAAVNYMIGEFKLKTGDLAEARKRLEISRKLREGLVKADDRNAILKRDLALALYRLGNLADRENNARAASETFEAARLIQDKLVSEDRTNDKRLIEFMPTLAHVGKIDEANEIADRLDTGPNADNEMRLEIARCYAQCARHTPAGQAEKSQRFLVKAVETLRKSVDNGFKDYVYVESEPDLDPLRARDDFKALLAKITPTK